MIAAVIDSATGSVVNVIVISDGDAAPTGTTLVAVPPGAPVASGWRYTAALGFLSPSAQRFYTFDGAATEIDVASARAIVNEDIATEATARKALSNDPVYRSAVDDAANEAAANIGALSVAECVAFRFDGWPRVGGI